MASDHSAEDKGKPAQPRPLTLLIACGIVLAATLLVVTGLVANYLRQQTLTSSEAAIADLAAVLTAAADRSLQAVDTLLDDASARLRIAAALSSSGIAQQMTAPQVDVPLALRVEAAPTIGGVALVDTDGAVLNRTGFWPPVERTVAGRDYFIALSTPAGLDSYIGAPIMGAEGQGLVIPVARKLRDETGEFAGAAVVAVPATTFSDFYRTVSLGDDGKIALVRRDGTVLTQFPAPDAAVGSAIDAPVVPLLISGDRGVVEGDRDAARHWRISAVRPLAAYPVSVIVSRDGDRALIGWSRQAEMFAAFAICGVAAIGLMVFLMGRQIRTHNALALMRAEKIEIEHARLLAEAELLKKERLSVLGQFTATVANELRNPLSAIRNTLFTMREIATTSGLTLDRPIARIQRSIARCDRIIGDLMEYIRTPELSRVSVNFDGWLREVLVEHGLPQAVTLVEDLAAADAIVRIDADRIRRVVINLIDNAAQALGEMPPGAGPLRILVRSAIGDSVLELTVADTGPGIPLENMTRIFEPLFSTKSFGAGLGLATVKQIVVQHGGTIAVDSEVGAGTTVTISLPLAQVLRIAA